MKKNNKKNDYKEKSPSLTPEQFLIGLSEAHEFIFEVWKKYPSIRKMLEESDERYTTLKEVQAYQLAHKTSL